MLDAARVVLDLDANLFLLARGSGHHPRPGPHRRSARRAPPAASDCRPPQYHDRAWASPARQTGGVSGPQLGPCGQSRRSLRRAIGRDHQHPAGLADETHRHRRLPHRRSHLGWAATISNGPGRRDGPQARRLQKLRKAEPSSAAKCQRYPSGACIMRAPPSSSSRAVRTMRMPNSKLRCICMVDSNSSTGLTLLLSSVPCNTSAC